VKSCFDGRGRRVTLLGGLALLVVTGSAWTRLANPSTKARSDARRCLTAGEAARDKKIWGPALAADVTGDHRVDRVRLARAWRSPLRCRFFVVLSSNGRTTATLVVQPELVNLPNAELQTEHIPRLLAIVSLPGGPRDVAVQLLAGGSTEFAGLFVPVGGTLGRVVIRPKLPDTNLLPYNGSVTHFDGVGCGAHSTVVATGAGALGTTGTQWTVVRTWYRQRAAQLVRIRTGSVSFHGSFAALRAHYPVLSPIPFPHCAIARAP
jgi:hypothetical protein